MESKPKPWIFMDIDECIDDEPNFEHDLEYQIARREAAQEFKQLERKEKEYADGAKRADNG